MYFDRPALLCARSALKPPPGSLARHPPLRAHDTRDRAHPAWVERLAPFFKIIPQILTADKMKFALHASFLSVKMGVIGIVSKIEQNEERSPAIG